MCGSTCHLFKEAWHRVKGMKAAFWGAVALFLIFSAGGVSLLNCLLAASGLLIGAPEVWHAIAAQTITLHDTVAISIKATALLFGYSVALALFEMFVLLPMRMGFQLLPLRRAVDRSVSALHILHFFKWEYVWRFVCLEVFIFIMLGIPGFAATIAFQLPQWYALAAPLHIACYVIGAILALITLYLAVCYFFASQLIIDRKMNPWAAMQLSRSTVSKRWFCVFGTIVWLTIVFCISTILFISLIWVMPYIFNVFAILYRDMLGIEGHDPVTEREKIGAV